MTPLEIKILLLKKGKTISGIARKYAEKVERAGSEVNLSSLRKQFSMCVNGERSYPQFQEFIAHEVNRPVEQLFPQKRREAA